MRTTVKMSEVNAIRQAGRFAKMSTFIPVDSGEVTFVFVASESKEYPPAGEFADRSKACCVGFFVDNKKIASTETWPAKGDEFTLELEDPSVVECRPLAVPGIGLLDKDYYSAIIEVLGQGGGTADAGDLKSPEPSSDEGSNPSPGTIDDTRD